MYRHGYCLAKVFRVFTANVPGTLVVWDEHLLKYPIQRLLFNIQ